MTSFQSTLVSKLDMDLAAVTLLKECAKKKDLCRGRKAHASILKTGKLEKSPHVGSALVNMYVKCGDLTKAQETFDELSVRNVVTWTSLISGFVQNGHGKDALNCFERMQEQGISPNSITFICAFKACGSIPDLAKGIQIHGEIVKQDFLRNDLVLCNAILNMYAKCGDLKKAKTLFDELPVRDATTWTTLISGYIQQGKSEEAIKCYKQMRSDGIYPDAITYTCILEACGDSGAIDECSKLHDEILHSGLLQHDAVLATALVDMHAKCGLLSNAEQVLSQLPKRTASTWNALITGYAQNKKDEEAMNCLKRMQSEGISPDPVTFICLLNVCSNTSNINEGKRIHDEIVHKGLLVKDVVLGNALVNMYVKCGELVKAEKVLLELPVQDTGSWNALIGGYVIEGQYEQAIKYLEKIENNGLSPNTITYIHILKACARTGSIEKGHWIHNEILRKCLLGKDTTIGNALVDMYVKLGDLGKAEQVLNNLSYTDIITWNTLISGYVQNGQNEEAFNCFKKLQTENLYPDSVTLICILKACGSIGAIGMGQKIHNEFCSKVFLGKSVTLGNALVNMYAKCGDLFNAEKVLYQLPIRETASWNAIIGECVQQGKMEEALVHFQKMKKDGHYPDIITYISLLKACGHSCDIDKGKQFHNEIASKRLLGNDIMLDSALVDMYVKFGEVSKAEDVFYELPIWDVTVWTSLLTGYAQQGHGSKALIYFDQMHMEGILPNTVTLLGLLTACNHSGLVEEGEMCFLDISDKYHLVQGVDHYTCIVDLFIRVGNLEKAMSVIRNMPYLDYPPIWSTVLGACQKSSIVNLGKLAFEKAIELDINDIASYVSMTKIYTGAGM